MEESEKLNFLSALLPVSVILFIIVLGVLRLNQQFNKKLYNQKLESEKLKLRHQKELLRASIRAQEEERKTIARNLHDELGAMISIMRMQLMQLENDLSENSAGIPVLQQAEKVRQLSETALHSMRQISHNLLPPQLETFGLAVTLEDTADQINLLSAMEMEMAISPQFPRLPHDVELGLYRIFMELTNNTLKHAGASQITVKLTHTDNRITMHFADNGKGLDEHSGLSGLGHKSIDARMHALDGHFYLLNNNDQGMEAVVELGITNFENR
jgi:signal transduction histidine kinase